MFEAMDHKKILQALLDRGMKQEELARELDTSQPNIARWLKSQEPKHDRVLAIIELGRQYGIVGDDNSDGHQESAPQKYPSLIPEIDLVAGLGGGGVAALEVTNHNGITFAKEAVRDHWRLPDWMMNRLNVKTSHVAAFPVQGDSMEPTIDNGDVVFIDTRHRVPSPPGIYALADEFGGVIVKRLEVVSRPGDETIMVRISSDNSRHNVRELTLPEVQIIGRYIGRFTI